MRLRAGFATLVCVFLLGACRVEVASDVVVERNGSGELTLVVSADDAAVVSLERAGFGDLAAGLFGDAADRALPSGEGGADPFEDLRAAGWEVSPVAGGLSFVHAWQDPGELAGIVSSLGGGDPALSPIRTLEVSKQAGFPKDNLEVTAVAGVDAQAVAALVGRGMPNSPTESELEDVFGVALEDLVSVRISVDVPGSLVELRADPAPASEDDLTWQLPPGGQLDLYVKTDYWNGLVRWTGIVAVVLLAAGAAFVVWRRIVVLRRRRARTRRPAPTRPRRPSSPLRRL